MTQSLGQLTQAFAAGGNPAESLFTSQTPTGTNNTDGTPGISVGLSVVFAVAGSVSHIRFFTTTTISGNYTGTLYEVTSDDGAGTGTGTSLGATTVASGTLVAGAWNTIALPAPVTITPLTKLYRAVLFSSAGRYVNSASSAFSGSSIVNGNITGPQNGSDPVGLGSLRQGSFLINAAAGYPTQPGNGTHYFADVVFTAS